MALAWVYPAPCGKIACVRNTVTPGIRRETGWENDSKESSLLTSFCRTSGVLALGAVALRRRLRRSDRCTERHASSRPFAKNAAVPLPDDADDADDMPGARKSRSAPVRSSEGQHELKNMSDTHKPPQNMFQNVRPKISIDGWDPIAQAQKKYGNDPRRDETGPRMDSGGQVDKSLQKDYGFYCEICKTECNSYKTFQSHNNSARHLKKTLERYEEPFADSAGFRSFPKDLKSHNNGTPRDKGKGQGKGQSPWHCEACNCDSTSEVDFMNHCSGRKHLLRINGAGSVPSSKSSSKGESKAVSKHCEKLLQKGDLTGMISFLQASKASVLSPPVLALLLTSVAKLGGADEYVTALKLFIDSGKQLSMDDYIVLLET
ncbi:unnamed protein product, partial [Polarella glacialis]